MREYEVIWEIFNKCPNNQMRDVFVDEIVIDDPEKFIQDIRDCYNRRSAKKIFAGGQLTGRTRRR